MTLGSNLNLVLLLEITAGVILIALGLGLGWWYSRSFRAGERVLHAKERHTLATVNRLAQWTTGMADQMSRYGDVVDGITQLFRDRHEPLDSDRREATGMLLTKVVEANTKLHQRLGHAEDMLKKQADELTIYMSEARTDTLTGLPNRRAFDEELGRRLSEWKRRQTPLSVMMIDIDHFKKVNDTYGHQAGDEILQQVANALSETVREADMVARIGGEELAVILPGTGKAEAQIAANRCRCAIEQARCEFQGQSLRVTASFGVACCMKDETDEQLLRRCDEALYAAKQNGRNRSFWHDGVRAIPIAANVDYTNPTRKLTSQPDNPRLIDSDRFVQICEDLRRRLAEVTQQDV